MQATVDLAMALWRKGEKVLIFCHYRRTGRKLHEELSKAMLKEVQDRACKQLKCDPDKAAARLAAIASRFDRTSGGDRSTAYHAVVRRLDAMFVDFILLGDEEIQDEIRQVVLRFLRTPTFLVRYANLVGRASGADWVDDLFNRKDASGLTLDALIRQFLGFLNIRQTDDERKLYLTSLRRIQTGTHAGPEVLESFSDDQDGGMRATLVANVRRVYGDTLQETRERITQTFNTPFYPEILISSSVMGEGVDLHLNCRHVIHHDLDWNPSSLEQRTGRIDRLGAKAETCGKPIRVYIPYIEGCQDEKLFRVVMDRERWFGVVMGADQAMAEVLKAGAWELERLGEAIPAPPAMLDGLALKLSVSA